MTNLEGMHSYFWLTSSRLKEPVQDGVPYTTRALRQDLLRVRNAWEECQASRERDAIYIYLTAVFDLVAWWAAEGRALERAHKALRLQRICPFAGEEPFAAVIRCTAEPAKVDKRTRSDAGNLHVRFKMVTRAAVRAEVQVALRTAGSVHQAEGSNQRVR